MECTPDTANHSSMCICTVSETNYIKIFSAFCLLLPPITLTSPHCTQMLRGELGLSMGCTSLSSSVRVGVVT